MTTTPTHQETDTMTTTDHTDQETPTMDTTTDQATDLARYALTADDDLTTRSDRRAVILPRGHTAEVYNTPTIGAAQAADDDLTTRRVTRDLGDRDARSILTMDCRDRDGVLVAMGAGRAIAVGADTDTTRTAHQARGTMPPGVTMVAVARGYRLTLWHGPAGFLVSVWNGPELAYTMETRDALLVLRVD